MSAKAYHVFGLGYGDEGKGSIVESIARRHQAVAVVRYNGGPQAAHHVVENGRTHCFSQFGSATMIPGVRTYLAHGMLVKPTNLLVEAEFLARIGVSDALERITISPNCYLVTPLHAMVGQMAEAVRGNAAHGSVGMGVGRAALDRANRPDSALKIQDLLAPNLQLKLLSHYEEKTEEARAILELSTSVEVGEIYRHYSQYATPEQMFQDYSSFVKILGGAIVPDEDALEEMAHLGVVVLEGAQGVLLDPTIGFTPHVTKTTVTPGATAEVLSQLRASNSTIHIGVTRAFTTRHGAGPFVTEEHLPYLQNGEHNEHNRWQGSFRYGWLDLVALRYSVSSSGNVNALAVTCLDRLAGHPVKVCTSYEYLGEEKECLDEYFIWDTPTGGKPRITGIKPVHGPTPERTRMLTNCRPLDFVEFPGWSRSTQAAGNEIPTAAQQFLDYLESSEGLGTQIGIVAFGPKAEGKHHLLDI